MHVIQIVLHVFNIRMIWWTMWGWSYSLFIISDSQFTIHSFETIHINDSVEKIMQNTEND